MARDPKKTLLAGDVGNEIAETVLERADELNRSKSSYVGAIIEKWYAEGCPPVDDVDRAFQEFKARQMKTEAAS